MVLRVSAEEFVHEVQTRLKDKKVYVQPSGRHCLASAADPESGLMIEAKFRTSAAKTTEALTGLGLVVKAGLWSTAEGDDIEVTPYLVAIAYRSEESTPGLWLDADLHEISSAEALKRMYDELRENGEIKAVSFDEFVRVIHPNVMIIPPHQILAWADEHP